MASDEEDDEANDPTYEYESEEDVTKGYPDLSDDGLNAPTSFVREGLEPWFPHDTLFNYRRYHVRQLLYAVRAFEKGRTCHTSFGEFWRANRLVGFLPVSPAEDNPDDPWTITKKELQRILRISYPKGSRMESEGFADDLWMMKTALPHAPHRLPQCHKVDPSSPACVHPGLGRRSWNTPVARRP